MTSNIALYNGKLPTLGEAKDAIELHRSYGIGDRLDPSYERRRRKNCLRTIDAFDRLAPTPPASLIVKEATKLLIAKPGIAAAAGEGFIPLLIEDLMMEIPEVSTMAILEGFHKLRMSTEPFKCTGEIITAIKKEEIEFRGARHNLLLSARHEGYVGPDRIVPPREPQRLLSKWTADDDDCDGEEPDTDGDLPY